MSRIGLTPAEERVCELAALGLTNREVAEALFVSVKAVEYHLHNAFLKLGVTNRTQLALWIVEQQRRTESAPGDQSIPSPPATLSSVQHEAVVQRLEQTLDSLLAELGGRVLTAEQIDFLSENVGAEVVGAISRQAGLDERQATSVEPIIVGGLRDGLLAHAATVTRTTGALG